MLICRLYQFDSRIYSPQGVIPRCPCSLWWRWSTGDRHAQCGLHAHRRIPLFHALRARVVACAPSPQPYHKYAMHATDMTDTQQTSRLNGKSSTRHLAPQTPTISQALSPFQQNTRVAWLGMAEATSRQKDLVAGKFYRDLHPWKPEP